MQITAYDSGLRLSGERVVLLGFFDGVHLAHRYLIGEARRLASERGCELCVFTFPSESVGIKRGTSRLYSTETKLALLREAGVDRVVLADFDAVCSQDRHTFVEGTLCRQLGCAMAVCGYNFRFAKGASADADDLRRLLLAGGRDCYIGDPFCFRDEVLSATRIRDWLRDGEMMLVNEALGRPYRMMGRAEHGRGLGRNLGTPTVNLSIEDGICLPRRGVYRCVARVRGMLYHAVTNLGTCPTFGEREVHAECYLLGYDGDLYGEELAVFFLGYLREERAFLSADELKLQIKDDIKATLQQNPPTQAMDA